MTGATVCLACPANTDSAVGSDVLDACICNIGYEGRDGAACSACLVGTYKAVNGSGECVACDSGTYLNVTAGSVCVGCPPGSGSPAGSDEITDCICNIGYEGSVDGAACVACALGTAKGVNGSGACLQCAAGTYLNVTAGSACVTCPLFTDSGVGSDAITDCICDVGYEAGSDGATCRAC
eukprot:3849808-Rhodomonas_salina.1